MPSWRLSGAFFTRSPLSHIGEAISTVSYLVQEPILQPDGTLAEVFAYSGNAWRGQLRDLCASYMIDKLSISSLPTDSFHLLYSGGRIGGEQLIDLERAREFRRVVPLLALFGGGVGNQILPGKLRVSNSYPACRETLRILPEGWQEIAARCSYRGLTIEKSFSRKDDSKDPRLATLLTPVPSGPSVAAARGDDPSALQLALLGGDEDSTAEEPSAPPSGKRAKRDGPADQMRMTVELLIAGVHLPTTIDLLDASEIELGCLVSALSQFSLSPHIGGQSNRGHGLVDLTYTIEDRRVGEHNQFIAIRDGGVLLSSAAESAQRAYDAYLREQYDAYLERNESAIVRVLGAPSARTGGAA